MDPLSIAASTAGLLTLTAQIITRGYACMMRLKSNDDDVRTAVNDVSSFSGILMAIESQCKERGDDIASPMSHLIIKNQPLWKKKVDECEAVLVEMLEILGTLTKANKAQLLVKGNSLWEKLQKSTTQIETSKSFFILCLQLQNKFTDEATKSQDQLLGALITQLLDNLPEDSPLPDSLTSMMKRSRFSSYPRVSRLKPVFLELCKAHATVYIVVDGLDELENLRDILGIFRSLNMSQTTSIKLFVSSRPNTELKTAFASYINVEILPEDVESDVQMFVRDNLEELLSGNEEEIDPGLLVMELATRAGGMFLWAVCQVQYLSRIRTTITPDLIATLPPALESIFENVLMTLEDKDRKMTLRILQLVMFAMRPLDLSEIDEAIAISPSSKSLAGLLRLRQKDVILELCGCMLSQSPRTKKIQLAHSSVYEFLTRKTTESSAVHDHFHFDDMTSHRELFVTCVRYLSMNDFDSDTFRETFRLAQDGGHADSDLQAFAKAPFLDYAVSHLISHMKKIELANDSDNRGSMGLAEKFFFEDSSTFTSWLLVRQYLDGTYRNPPGSNAYHIAAIYGIEQVFGLGPDQYGLKAQTLDGRNVLHLALENQQWEIVDAILRLGLGDLLSDFDKQGRSPLHVTVELGNTFMVQRLIEGGADPNLASPLNQGRTPIFMAVENKWDELTEYLSGKANLDICLDDGRSLHHVAAQSGSPEWITALEGSHGGSTTTPSPANRVGSVRRDDNGWTPLHYAADLGHTDIIPRLMASGYAANEVDKNGWTPLHAAIRRRFIKSAKALLDRMAPMPLSDDSVSRLRTNRPGSSMTVPEPYDYYGLQTDTSSFTFSNPSASRPSESGKYGAHFNPRNEPTPVAASQPQPAYTYNSLRSQLTAPISGLLSAVTGRAARPPGGDPATSQLNRIPTSPEPAVSLRRNPRPGGGDDRFPSSSSTREALRHRALSPLYVAVADAYTEGVELLVKHRAKLPAWGLTEEEKAKCLKMALEISNTSIAMPLLELFGEENIWDAIPQLIVTGNDEIIGKVKARISEETAYKVLIGKGLHTKQIDMVSFVLTTWPKPFADLAVLAVELCAASMPNQDTATSELLETMVQKYVADFIRDTDQAAQDGKQSSLLTQALEGRHLRAATVLIDRGADLHVRNREGETPLLSLPRIIPAYARKPTTLDTLT
ncbi:conserved hypothetical protein [Verticillium alfalfae VaMs.102]|uniref:Ankyrin repeat protein n=1 Tax=Verticillium alfalfae (strain VaMs.102 / ATCC MYA-4576 / FGSC 10136) TaxID=526221 RepID=C9SDQ7_VERA1|nr:conserved hypothetical protein [Verticillium alfalfae VaMs.102]EEY17177.1 conserved hypothetical protein [Verticillium alfalfae VaMs.102]